jgi:hypothetical protein
MALLQIRKVKDAFKGMRGHVKDAFDDLHKAVEDRRQEIERDVKIQERIVMTSLKTVETSRASVASNASTVEKLITSAPQSALLGMVADLLGRLDRVQFH